MFVLNIIEKHREQLQSCIRKNNTEISDAIKSTDEVLVTFLKIPYIPSEDEIQSRKNDEFKNVYNSSAFLMFLDKLRHLIMNTGPSDCEMKFQLLLTVYTRAIAQAILFSPNFYESELSKLTFMHVFALQHALETHQHMSTLCYLAYEYFTYGMFINLETEIDFVLNVSAAFAARDLTLSLDDSISELYHRLLLNQSFPVQEFTEITNSVVEGRQVSLSFSQWYHMCRHVAKFNELFEDELSKKIRMEGFDVEWRNCVAGEKVF